MINKKGVALVIANSAYITQPKLKSCKKDGEDMRGALERLNFDVFFAENQNRAELFNIISEFLKNADLYSTVLLYYTGHGVQIDGDNYFVPIDCTYNPIKAIFGNESCTRLYGCSSGKEQYYDFGCVSF